MATKNGENIEIAEEIDPNKLISKDGVLGYERGPGFEQVTNFDIKVDGYVGDGEGNVIGYIVRVVMAIIDPLLTRNNTSSKVMSKSKTRLYFGKLHETTRERDLEKFVRGYGKIREISVKRGYGFVEFYDARDAEDVVYELNGRDLLGERVIIEHAREPSRRDWGYNSHGSRSYNSRPSRDYHSRRNLPIRTEHRLAVENLSSRINWQELKEFFNKAGDVTFTDAHKRKTGIGIVEFATKDDMKNALRKLDGVELNGKKLKLAIEAVRSRSRSRSRGRRSRSHSPKRHRHHSRSRSPRRSHSQSPSKTGEEKQGSKSRSRSKSEERKSRSPSHEKEEDESNHESGRESSNGSPRRNGEDDENGNEEEEDE